MGAGLEAGGWGGDFSPVTESQNRENVSPPIYVTEGDLHHRARHVPEGGGFSQNSLQLQKRTNAQPLQGPCLVGYLCQGRQVSKHVTW